MLKDNSCETSCDVEYLVEDNLQVVGGNAKFQMMGRAHHNS